jgi:hypothetical protein
MFSWHSSVASFLLAVPIDAGAGWCVGVLFPRTSEMLKMPRGRWNLFHHARA